MNLRLRYNLVFDSKNHKNANVTGILVGFLRPKMSTNSFFGLFYYFFDRQVSNTSLNVAAE